MLHLLFLTERSNQACYCYYCNVVLLCEHWNIALEHTELSDNIMKIKKILFRITSYNVECHGYN